MAPILTNKTLVNSTMSMLDSTSQLLKEAQEMYKDISNIRMFCSIHKSGSKFVFSVISFILVEFGGLTLALPKSSELPSKYLPAQSQQ